VANAEHMGACLPLSLSPTLAHTPFSLLLSLFYVIHQHLLP